ncbi:MAG: class I SAM-dependent methyltransferase, partial [Pseudomonadota bacterium]
MPAEAAALTRHYQTEDLLGRIRAALKEAGADPTAPSPDDLKPVDEFHTGGLEATEALLSQLEIGPDMTVLDLGSGIGGTARYIAHRFGARVTGVDLTPQFVDVATALSAMCGLEPAPLFLAGSVTDLPVEDGAFDLATMFHVGMNIADKPRLFFEASRALRPGGRFALFDIMAGTGEIGFPAPWSPNAANSFVATPEVYRAAAAAAGFTLIGERDRGAYARDFFTRVIAASADGPPPPVGLHLLMGDGAAERYVNAVTAAMNGATVPWEMIFQKPA